MNISEIEKLENEIFLLKFQLNKNLCNKAIEIALNDIKDLNTKLRTATRLIEDLYNLYIPIEHISTQHMKVYKRANKFLGWDNNIE